MVSSVGFQLNSRRKITGFGTRKRTTGRGVIRRVVGSVTRPVLGFLANKIADAISGGGRRVVHRRRTVRHTRVHHAGSYRLTGMGARRKPRARLAVRRVRRVGSGVRRAPRRHLVHRRRRVMY